jgi:hypothetical protein
MNIIDFMFDMFLKNLDLYLKKKSLFKNFMLFTNAEHKNKKKLDGNIYLLMHLGF